MKGTSHPMVEKATSRLQSNAKAEAAEAVEPVEAEVVESAINPTTFTVLHTTVYKLAGYLFDLPSPFYR